MPKFHFRYQTLLEQRQRIEDQCQRELALHMRERMILQTQIQRMQSTISESKRELANGLVGHVDVRKISDFARFAGQTSQSAAAMVHRLAQKEKSIGESRQALDMAMRQRKAIELLREKDHRAWQAEQERREMAQTDEIAIQAYVRRVAGEAVA